MAKRKKRNHSIIKSFNKTSSFLRIVLVVVIVAGCGVLIYGPQRAFWEFSAKINGLIDPTGYVASFIDPILKNGDQRYEDKIENYKLGIVTDSHSDTTFYPMILEELKRENVSLIVHLGDTVSEGSIKNLNEAKMLLDEIGIPYYTVCGNHDHNFWPVRQTKNYQEVFGDLSYSFKFSNLRGVVINNSSGYLGVGRSQMDWLEGELEDQSQSIKFLFLHIPPYHPFLSHVMGEENPELEKEAQEILRIAKEGGVDEIFSGHLHSYSRFFDPEQKIKITVVGAAGTDRNLAPSYVLVTVFKDQSYRVENRVLDRD